MRDQDKTDITAVNTIDTTSSVDASRRQFFRQSIAGAFGAAAALNIMPTGIKNMAHAAGSDAPEITEVKIGFIPLTDCAPIVVAAQMGFDKKYGIKITPSKEASWAGVRDKLINGELQGAHVLYGMMYGSQLGIGGQQKDMAVLMALNNNGQGITLSNQLKDKGVKDGRSLKRLISNENRDYTFAQTFPTGTHAMWLNYWLAANDIDPIKDVKNIVVPPPQMVANMRIGNM
ncbi:MAG TPA: CmpA/NrtA family ABC transporter substrate-binding protein, partial [Methylotenera sp.]|nr:CmpA/NrtA family ABC transporter substrate-binding protein [Methylotenera sp.]